MDGRAEEYLNQEDFQDQVEQMEDNQELVQDVEWAEVPQRRKQDSLYDLFQRVWKAKNSSKVANLTILELGKPVMTVRDAQYLSLLATTFKHPRFAQFFQANSEITLATSASKKGWFTELFVSQKKFTTRSMTQDESAASSPNQKGKKWNIFGGKNPQSPMES